MILAKEIMGSSLIERSSFISSSTVLLNFRQNQSQFLLRPALEKRKVLRLKKSLVAAISEDLVKTTSSFSVVAEKAVKFKVRAVLTVRNKIKEDFRETIVKHFDAFADRIGRNVVLQLVSTEIDPSKNHLFFFPFFFLFNFWVSQKS